MYSIAELHFSNLNLIFLFYQPFFIKEGEVKNRTLFFIFYGKNVNPPSTERSGLSLNWG